MPNLVAPKELSIEHKASEGTHQAQLSNAGWEKKRAAIQAQIKGLESDIRERQAVIAKLTAELQSVPSAPAMRAAEQAPWEQYAKMFPPETRPKNLTIGPNAAPIAVGPEPVPEPLRGRPELMRPPQPRTTWR